MNKQILRLSALVYFFVLLFIFLKFESPQNEIQVNEQVKKIKELNEKTMEILSRLIKTKYFRIIRLNLNSQCPLPYMNKLCRQRSCSVCRCTEDQIPLTWISTDRVHSAEADKDVWSKQRDLNSNKWIWHVQDEQNDQGQYFDINANVQSYSGYNGSYIWGLVYEQNCFKGAKYLNEMCTQEKVLYRLISGLHTSISSHLSRLYKNITSISLWADKGDEAFFFNHQEYERRVLNHPERIENLLFLYQTLMRSLHKMSHYLQQNHSISSDNILEDLHSTKLLSQLLSIVDDSYWNPIMQMQANFFTMQNIHVKQYQHYIHNISRILNCVQCQKCKLFGKMQTYGLGTALKVLLGCGNLKRNQVVAIVNTLNKVSVSVSTYFNYIDFLPKTESSNKRVEKYLKVKKIIEGIHAEQTKQEQQDIGFLWGVIGFAMLVVEYLVFG